MTLIALFTIPVTHAQTHAPLVATVQAERSERTRATASFPAAPTVSASAPATAAPKADTKPTQKPVAKTTPPAAAAPAPTITFAEQIEQEVYKLVNAERTKQGLGALKLDTRLAGIARAHSQDMLDNNYFSHTDLNGCNSSCRVSAAGYAWSAVGENIYTMSGYTLSAQETARHMVEGWMNSPGHRANILNGTYTNHGVGLAVSGSTIYATSVFSLPQ